MKGSFDRCTGLGQRRSSGVVRLSVLDVGGTSMAAAEVVLAECNVGRVVERRSPVSGSASEIVLAVVETLQAATPDPDLSSGTVVCFPAPFDYVGGVSLMHHKFERLYGVPLVPPIRDAIGTTPQFFNDADAAAVGVWSTMSSPPGSMVAITLGTGVGSALLQDGIPVDSASTHELWSMPYGRGIIEDYVSSEALRSSYKARSGEETDVKTIAERARSGDARAGSAFEQFGHHLGVGLTMYLAELKAPHVVFAGGIASSWDLFGMSTVAAFHESGGNAQLEATSQALPALLGGAILGERALDEG